MTVDKKVIFVAGVAFVSGAVFGQCCRVIYETWKESREIEADLRERAHAIANRMFSESDDEEYHYTVTSSGYESEATGPERRSIRTDTSKPTIEDLYERMQRGEHPPEDIGTDLDKADEEELEAIEKLRDEQEDIHDMRSEYGDEPFIIDETDYDNGPSMFEQIQCTYYAGDDTLCDDQENIIQADFIGIDNIAELNPHRTTIFVRNLRQSADYEVVFDPRSYKYVVMGELDDDEPTRSKILRNRRRENGD